MRLTSLVVFATILFGISPAFAETSQSPQVLSVDLDLSKLSPRDAAMVMDLKKQIENHDSTISIQNLSPEKVREWGEFGKGIGEAIGAAAKSLSIGVNEFISTPAGAITIAVIVWHFMGAELWDIFGGTFIWMVMSFFIWRSYSKFHLPMFVTEKLEDGTTRTHLETYEFKSGDAEISSIVIHTAIAAVFTGFMLLIIF